MKPSHIRPAPPQTRPPQSDREAPSSQLDLFADRGRVTPRHSPKPMGSLAAVSAETLTDEELLALAPEAGPSSVEAVCSQLVSRSLETAVPALDELARLPSMEVIEAIKVIWDDDAIVHLGRCARRNPQLAGAVLDALRDIGSPRAEMVASNLESAIGSSTPTGD